ncbi:hypothetical protein ACFPER_01925 [Agromyces aurantiacus]|uniref:DUF7882 domain-containing protein n=1 Tax=Agromyces aurantiacus TaxID=165814 RepID=A0ABV9R255_9MICO|nr:hypothetical protein [Agromyces aurantiacus]MBM7505844.1 hypothetical protein [Agromyces aurantiacus]
MGQLAYGIDGHQYEIDDTTLRHLRVAVIAKLRRQEPFALTLRSPGTGAAAETLWVQPSIPLRFVFDDAESGPMDREWLEKLVAAANSAGGMQVELERVQPALALVG